MHTPSGKDEAAFQKEFEHILEKAGDGVADFTGFVFPSSNYVWRKFKAHCVFSGATFTQYASFYKARFAQGANFSEARFTQSAEFKRATFMQDVSFNRSTFARNAYFISVTFTQDANFIEATFTQDANFIEATFTQDANFNWATFTRRADFRRATFAQDANFGWATFTQDADFFNATFRRGTTSAGGKFFGAALFRETRFREDERRYPGPVFSLTEFSRPEATVFYKTFLGQALFHNCDVSKFNFSSVRWRKRERRGKRAGKRMVFEEVVALDDPAAVALKPEQGNRDERDYGLIAELYQQLKKNYDERKDYWTAGDFHYGEMEMKRLHSESKNALARWLDRNLGLVAWYKYASEYGESYIRPVMLLFVVLALFTLLFPWAGLERNENSPYSAASVTQQTRPPAAISELSYKHFSEFASTRQGRKWGARFAFLGNSFMTAMSVAGFQKELKYEPRYPWGRALALLELLFTSTLLALFLLALRRQFRR